MPAAAVETSPPPVEDLTGDEVSARRFHLIAKKIQADPALLQIPLTNIERWLADGHAAADRLNGWKQMIVEAQASQAGIQKLVDLLCDQNLEAMMWKGYSPFPGVLTKEEIQSLRWKSRH